MKQQNRQYLLQLINYALVDSGDWFTFNGIKSTLACGVRKFARKEQMLVVKKSIPFKK